MIQRRSRTEENPKNPGHVSANAVPGSSWQLQAAKAKFSEVFRRARDDGPQIVTRGGTDAVVVIPLEQYELLLARSQQPRSLVKFLRNSPLSGLNLHIERDRDTGRNTEL